MTSRPVLRFASSPNDRLEHHARPRRVEIVGATWRQNDAHEWRFGALYDESPVRADTLRPSIPDSNRWAPTVGYGYTGRRWTVDVYYMYLVFTDAEAKGNIAEGVIDATYSSAGHITGITFGWRL